MTDLSSIRTVLELSKTEVWVYPMPTTSTWITFSWALVWEQWTFWEATRVAVKKLNTVPVDPLTQNPYTYSVLNTLWEYELGAALEWNISYENNILSDTTYASSDSLKAYVIWNYNQQIAKVSISNVDYILAVPTIISDSVDETDLLEIINRNKLTFRWGSNLPHSYWVEVTWSWTKLVDKDKVVVFSGSLKNLWDSNVAILKFLKDTQDAYSGSEIIVWNLKQLMDLNTTWEFPQTMTYWKVFLENVLDTPVNLQNLGCIWTTHNWYTVTDLLHSQVYTFNKPITITNWNSSGSLLVSCNNGTMQYWLETISTTCDSWYVEWPSHTCIADVCNSTITDPNAHSTATSQSASSTWNYSTTPSVCTFVCNDNFTWNGTSCVANTRLSSCTDLPTNAVWNSVSEVTQTWNWTLWGPSLEWAYSETTTTAQCKFKCNTNYSWNWTACVWASQTNSCTWLVANAEWNTASSISQTWNWVSYSPTEVWAYNIASSTSSCNYKCISDYHTEDNSSCVANIRECTIANWTWTQTWDTNTSTWSSCSVYSCQVWFHSEWWACVDNNRSCLIQNWIGVETWISGTSTWSPCSMVLVIVDFTIYLEFVCQIYVNLIILDQKWMIVT